MLRDIILHHSYHTGLRVKIPCAGHTYFLGTNGAGKTSALSLIPIFYGKDPASMVERKADKSSFVDYYLPNLQSMIVFEYQRLNGEICCAVMYRKEGGQYAYRFIKGEANQTLFHDNLSEHYERGRPANEILKYELPKHGVEVSNQIVSTIDYRSIIQNDPMSSGRRRRERSAPFTNTREAREYSLGGAGDKMQHIESLAAVALNKGRLLENLKSMIVDTMIQGKTAIRTPQPHHKNKELWDDLASLQDFAKDSQRLRKGLGTYAGLLELRHDLVGHMGALEAQIKAIESAVRDLENNSAELDKNIEKLGKAFNERRHELVGEATKHQAVVDDRTRWLDTLDNERSYWDEQGIEDKKRFALRRQNFENERRLAINQLDALLAQANEIEKRFDQQHKDVEQAFEDERERLRKREQGVWQQRSSQASRAKEAAEKFNRQCASELVELRSRADEAMKHIRDEIDRAHDQLAKAQGYLPVEQNAMKQSQEAVDNAKRDLSEFNAARNAAQEEKEQAIKKRDSALNLVKEAESDLRQLDEQVQRLTAQLNPADNTLLAFLRNSELPWRETLGKVIDPQLLLRKDLSPQLAEPANLDQAFGLSINLNVLPGAESTDADDVLQSKLERAESDLRLASSTLEQRQDAAQKSLRDLKDYERSATLADNRVRDAHDKLNQADASHNTLKATLKMAVKQRKTDAETNLKAAKDKESEHQEHTQRMLEECDSRHERQRQQNKADDQHAEQELNRSEQAIAEEKAALERNLGVKRKELAIQREQAMSDKGVDTQTVRSVEQTRDAASKALQQIKDDEEAIRVYSEWVKHAWAAKPDKEQELAEAQRLLNEVKSNLQVLDNNYKAKHKAMSDKMKEIANQAKEKKALRKEWGDLAFNTTKLLEDIPIKEQPLVGASQPDARISENAEQLVGELRRLVRTGIASRNEVTHAAQHCHNLVRRHHQSKIYQEWQNIREHRKNTSVHAEGRPIYYIEMMADVETLLDHRLPQVERALIESVHSVGAHLSDYYQDLRNLDKSVEAVSRQLSQSLNMDHSFDVITDVSIEIRSKVHQLGFWAELGAFSESWTAWMTTGFKSLPSEELLKRVQLLEDGLRHARMEVHDLKSLVELKIEFYEQSRRVPIRTDSDLGEASSVGISRLAILVIFSALTRYLCPNPDINITWPLDELGQLATENIDRLFKMMGDRNISLFCAEPKLSHELQGHFANRVAVSKHKGVMTMTSDHSGTRPNPLLAQAAMPAVPQEAPSRAIEHGAVQ